MKRLLNIIAVFALTIFAAAAAPVENEVDAIVAESIVKADSVADVDEITANDNSSTEAEIDPKAIIFEHLGDAYGWEVPFDHHHRIPLPIIVYGNSGFHCFSSARVSHHNEDGLYEPYIDGDAIFRIANEGEENAGKIVELQPDGTWARPWDFSITKNVAALFISVLLVMGLMLWLAAFHRKHPNKAPRKGLGAVEACVTFIYDGVVKSTLGHNAKRFGPYLMSVFFFILAMNLLGLIVIFPGGANLTGNIAVTLVLSIITFLITNIFANKHYWKEIFWPEVPIWLKCPIPIMQLIEVFGMFTKPAALTIRLFANMMGGHMIVLTLTLLIFIFTAVSPIAGGGATVISLLFSIFMLLIDVLVSFIQAYVFTLLSTIFIGLAHEHEHEEEKAPRTALQVEPADAATKE